MSSTTLTHLFLGMITAAGVWLFVSGLAGFSLRRASGERMEPFLGQKGRRQIYVTDLPPLAQRLLAQL